MKRNVEAAKPSVVIRKAERKDADTMLRLIDALAEYEKLEPPDAAAKERLIADCFSERPRFDMYLADVDGRAVGYAIILETYSSFKALPTLYLEDLFVLSDARGLGVGFTLFQFVVAEAQRRGCGRVEWVVLNWNKIAIDFYDRMGASRLDDWHTYRLSENEFSRITGIGK